jgi:hypothetical protein
MISLIRALGRSGLREALLHPQHDCGVCGAAVDEFAQNEFHRFELCCAPANYARSSQKLGQDPRAEMELLPAFRRTVVAKCFSLL